MIEFSFFFQYFVKFVDSYGQNGVDIFAVTMQNEPYQPPDWESMHWDTKEMAEFVGDYLGSNSRLPLLRFPPFSCFAYPLPI